MIKFESTLQQINKWTILQLPDSASEKLPSRGQVMVEGTINGRSFQQVLEPDGRWGHWLKLDAKMRKSVGVNVGDNVKFEIMPSKVWPEPDIPTDFLKALAGTSTKVQNLWNKITPMARWEWMRWINATNNNETRQRRIEVSISKLQSGMRRPCCFNRAACTDPDLTKNGRLLEIP